MEASGPPAPNAEQKARQDQVKQQIEKDRKAEEIRQKIEA